MVRAAGAIAAAVICLAGCGSESDPALAGSSTTTTTECSNTHDTTPVPVVVIVDDIAAGTTAVDAIAGGALEEKEIDWGYRPVSAVDSLDDLIGGVAIADLEPNQIAVVNQWGLTPELAVGDPSRESCPG